MKCDKGSPSGSLEHGGRSGFFSKNPHNSNSNNDTQLTYHTMPAWLLLKKRKKKKRQHLNVIIIQCILITYSSQCARPDTRDWVTDYVHHSFIHFTKTWWMRSPMQDSGDRAVKKERWSMNLSLFHWLLFFFFSFFFWRGVGDYNMITEQGNFRKQWVLWLWW